MKVLVTGGGGTIGKSVINGLINRNYTITSLSRNSYPELEKFGIKQELVDIRDYDKVRMALEGQDAVFHVAAKVGLWGRYDDFHSTNVMGTNNIIKACIANEIRYLIYTSSASVVFDGSDINNGTERLPYPEKPVSYYTGTKALAEQLILRANSSALKTISLRPHLVWGPGDNHIIPGILKRAKAGTLRQIGVNESYIDTTHIDNLCDAQLCALDSLRNNIRADGQAYFITNDEPIKVWDFINSILKAHAMPPIQKKISVNSALTISWILEKLHKIFIPGKEPALTRFAVNEACTSHWFNISKAKKLLSYEPKVSIKQGLNDLSQLQKAAGR